jgi:hypothetical protein
MNLKKKMKTYHFDKYDVIIVSGIFSGIILAIILFLKSNTKLCY